MSNINTQRSTAMAAASRAQRHGDQDEYPQWICSTCGAKFGKRRCSECSTWHTGKCDICGIEASVTEPRDFRLGGNSDVAESA